MFLSHINWYRQPEDSLQATSICMQVKDATGGNMSMTNHDSHVSGMGARQRAAALMYSEDYRDQGSTLLSRQGTHKAGNVGCSAPYTSVQANTREALRCFMPTTTQKQQRHVT